MCYYRDPNGAESNNKHLDEETPYWDSYDSINQLYLELGNDTFLLQSLHTSILLCKFILQFCAEVLCKIGSYVYRTTCFYLFQLIARVWCSLAMFLYMLAGYIH